MKYELPKPRLILPAGVKFETHYVGKFEDVPLFGADQMQAAYQAGRDSMRYEGELPELPDPDGMATDQTDMYDDVIYRECYDADSVQDYARQAIAGVLAKQSTSGDYAKGYAEGFNDACKPEAQPKPAEQQAEPVKNDPQGCAYCNHQLFAGLKCKKCGWVAQPMT